MFRNIYLLIVLVSVLIFGIFLGREVLSEKVDNSCVSKLKLIKQNLDCETLDYKVEILTNLQAKLEVKINDIKKTNKAKRVSVFVRDLNTSRFMGINDGETYYMASLLKTPVLIGGFKLAEVEPKILDQEIVYTGKPNLYSEQVIKADENLKVGETYNIKELMRRSIIYSDNTAAQLLYDYFPEGFLDRIMQAIGIQITKPTSETENLMTARSYANIFRILFNASYLTKEYSNEALSIMTGTTFNKGATAKLPKDVLVAHKFAERTVIDPTNKSVAQKQFHECGIVYNKDSSEPYSFCILTEGSDYLDLEEVVSDISLIIYYEMNVVGNQPL
ncbi:MAG: serine hydrolase [Minisyncoccia bacterium]